MNCLLSYKEKSRHDFDFFFISFKMSVFVEKTENELMMKMLIRP